MSITIDDYGYIYIKLCSIKSLIMKRSDLKKISSINDLDSLGSYAKKFFPNFNPEEETLAEYEWALWNTYFSIVEKILISSPVSIQIFLKSFLLKFEIWNLKICIHGIIEKTSEEKLYHEVFDKPSYILERSRFLKELLIAKDFTELKEIVEKTPYKKIIKNGIDQYNESNEIFYIENELDKLFYTNLMNKSKLLPKREKQIIQEYIKSQIDFYSLNLIYRAIYNKIDVEKIKPYLISNGYILNKKKMLNLAQSKSIKDFLNILKKILQNEKKREYFVILEKLADPTPKTWNELQQIILAQFLSRFEHQIISDIRVGTFALIFKILLLKQQEIKKLVSQAVKISLTGEDIYA